MVKRLATSRHDPLSITDSACKNQLVVVNVQYGPFNTYIPIRSTTIGKSRVARDLITMHTSWRSNSDISSVTRQTHLPKTHPVLWSEIYHTIISSDNIGYPCIKASGESSTTKHRLLHASGLHPIPPPNDPKTNQYNKDLGLIHSTNGNHLESPNEGSSIDHQVTIHLHAQNITMFPTNETWLCSCHSGYLGTSADSGVPPRRSVQGRVAMQVVDESRALDSDEGEDVAQPSGPLRSGSRQVEDKNYLSIPVTLTPGFN
ncbi:hypothetical protein F511_34545 [Dorcoceras hygrometricum]|uniref:Uncharacterized protein n=1 Tax=Dorcoceras hygrometricum TaxID=472368 RepID=A0A2Z7C837_9LAMI|nr:hypothetical protein F511_34545 [Dorcoceras hygrometricum]